MQILHHLTRLFSFDVFADGTGEVNQAGIDHYNRLIDALLANGNQLSQEKLLMNLQIVIVGII